MSSYRSKSTRKKVMLRCFFVCTNPECDELACDLHHIDEQSSGGSNEHTNLIGLCKKCHQEVHRNEILKYEAKEWLANQLDPANGCPTRINRDLRFTLFQEILAATKSLDSMIYHNISVYDRNYWQTQEVFLKATWRYLIENNMTNSAIGCIVLIRMVNLYRRRRNKRYFRAAWKKLEKLEKLMDDLKDNNIKWLYGGMLFHKGYLLFLDPKTRYQSYDMFINSRDAEYAYGDREKGLISYAQSLYVINKGGTDIINDSKIIEDKLRNCKSEFARRWGGIELRLLRLESLVGRNQINKAVNILNESDLLGKEYDVDLFQSYIYLYWYSIIESDCLNYESALKYMQDSLNAALASGVTERLSAIYISLGDIYLKLDNLEIAIEEYNKAIKLPKEYDNQESIEEAFKRLNNIKNKNYKIDKIFRPSSKGKNT